MSNETQATAPIAVYPPNEICESCREVGIEIGKVAVHLCPRHRSSPAATEAPPESIWLHRQTLDERMAAVIGVSFTATAGGDEYILKSTSDARIQELENRLNEDSQNFQILCLRETEVLLRAELTKLREALRGLMQRPSLFYVYHTNVEDGNYLECRFCKGESPGGIPKATRIEHEDECEFAAAREAMGETK